MDFIVEKTGNLLETTDRYILHGVNCQNVFGAGIAGQIAKKWPGVAQQYKSKGNAHGWNLGEIQFCMIDYPRYVVNIATQQYYGRSGLYTNYDAIKVGVSAAIIEAHNIEQSRGAAPFDEFGVSISRIGCGLGGADWAVVKEILSDIAHIFPFVKITVWSLDGGT